MHDFLDIERIRRGPPRLETEPNLRTPILLRLLDEIDYGVVLMDPEGAIHHANHLARHELASGRILCNEDGFLAAADPLQTCQLRTLALRALQGHRSLAEIGSGEHSITLAFVPLASPYETDLPTVLVLFGKRQVCEGITMSFYARSCGLTAAEETVLKGLCDGLDVDAIARNHGVAESTVRTQVRILRTKTRSNSIRQLIRKVSTLPPVVPAVRGAFPDDLGRA